MKIKVNKRVVYTTNQTDKKILEVGEKDISDFDFLCIKNNPYIEVIGDKNIETSTIKNFEKNIVDVNNNEESIKNNIETKEDDEIEIKEEVQTMDGRITKNQKRK